MSSMCYQYCISLEIIVFSIIHDKLLKTSLLSLFFLLIFIFNQASTQTDVLKLPPSQPPRLLKNKALLCKPITQTKATSCKPHTQNKECQTGIFLALS